MLVLGPRVPLLLEVLERLTDNVGLIDRVDSAPGPPVRLLNAYVTRAAGTVIVGKREPLQAIATSKAVDSVTMAASALTPWLTAATPPAPVELLVRDGADDEVARQPQANRDQNLGGEDHRLRISALHVDGPRAE